MDLMVSRQRFRSLLTEISNDIATSDFDISLDFQDKFHLQNQLDRSLTMIEQQQKDLKEGSVRVNDLTLQVGNLKNILDSKVGKIYRPLN